jgi:microcystin-dependent protein
MPTPFMSEIKIMSFNFAPKGWALCNGQLLPINQNQALFALLGTTYGGDGRVNFGLPNLQGRVPMHMGAGHTLGERGGEENHTLIMSEMGQHTHAVMAVNADASAPPPGRNPSPAHALAEAHAIPSGGGNVPVSLYSTAAPSGLHNGAGGAVSNTGGSQAHSNQQPYTVLSMCIALQGIFPSQN